MSGDAKGLKYLLTFANSKGENLAKIINFPGSQGTTPLYCASESNRVEVTSYLLDFPETDIFKETDDGITPFFSACNLGNERIVSAFFGKFSFLPVIRFYY